jgi:superoxide reductase
MKRFRFVLGILVGLCLFGLSIAQSGFSAMKEGTDMTDFKELFQSGDWKMEKHTPVITAPDIIKKGEACEISVSVGKEVPHPNTTEHHISWIEVYFLPEGEKFPVQLGRFEFTAHGASTKGPDTSTVYTKPEVTLNFKTEKSGTLYAVSYCNIHGLWQNAQSIKVQ